MSPALPPRVCADAAPSNSATARVMDIQTTVRPRQTIALPPATHHLQTEVQVVVRSRGAYWPRTVDALKLQERPSACPGTVRLGRLTAIPRRRFSSGAGRERLAANRVPWPILMESVNVTLVPTRSCWASMSKQGSRVRSGKPPTPSPDVCAPGTSKRAYQTDAREHGLPTSDSPKRGVQGRLRVKQPLQRYREQQNASSLEHQNTSMQRLGGIELCCDQGETDRIARGVEARIGN